MKIVILDGYTANPGDLSWAGLEALGQLTVYERTHPAQVAERIGDTEIVLTNKTPVTEQALSACPGIRYIGVLATGYNIVDVHAAKARGIPVTNVPGYSTASVAQLTFALILELCHHAGHLDSSVKQGRWTQSPDFCFWDHPLVELAGKTLGIIGLGSIGAATAQIARAFGMHVLACKSKPAAGATKDGIALAPMEDILAASDIISLHCPLFPSTQDLIRRDTIAKMKRGVWIINTSRGPLVNEADILQALTDGSVGYYAADVVSAEPIRADNPLLQAPNTLLTPHIAWAPLEARTRLLDAVAANVKAFMEGHPVNVVNK